MAGEREGEPEGREIERRDAARRHRHALGVERDHDLVHPTQDVVRLRVLERDRAQHVADLHHVRRRVHAVSRDVGDHQREVCVVEQEGVVPVASDRLLLRGLVVRADRDAVDHGEGFGQGGALEQVDGGPFALGGMFGLAQRLLRLPKVVTSRDAVM